MLYSTCVNGAGRTQLTLAIRNDVCNLFRYNSLMERGAMPLEKATMVLMARHTREATQEVYRAWFTSSRAIIGSK
jgi:hypothetical protein